MDTFVTPKINTVKSLLKNQAYDIIKAAIINNSLKPDQIYSQEFLSKKLGISRTPVREALLQLQLENVIHIHRGRGIEIIAMTKDDLQDLLEMAEAVECKSCELAAQRLTDETIAELEKIHDYHICTLNNQQWLEFMHADEVFHRIIAVATENKRIVESIDDIHEKLNRSALTFIYNNDKMSLVFKEHEVIIAALKKRDPDSAVRAMRKHIEGIFIRSRNFVE